MTQKIKLSECSGLIITTNSDLSNPKDAAVIKKTAYCVLSDNSQELKNVRDDIITLTQEKREFLVHYDKQKEEEIVLSGGTLIGKMNNRYFCCWCYIPSCKLFFKEANDLGALMHAPDMKPERIKVLFEELDERFAQNPAAKYLRLQMQSVQEIWKFLHTLINPNSSDNRYHDQREKRFQSERQKAINAQVAEAETAKQRRLENEERNRQRKAEREAERLKRKKIAQTTKRVNADAAKAAAERKAEEERKAQMQKEAQLKAQEESKRAEIKRVIGNMFQAFDKHPSLPPVYERNKNGDDCFYFKINGKVMHVVMSETDPLCHFLNPDKKSSKPLGIYDIQDIMMNINEHLNANGDFDELLGNFALFYKKCQQIMTNKNTINDKRTEKQSENMHGVIVRSKTVVPLYTKVCQKLMSPYTFDRDNQHH